MRRVALTATAVAAALVAIVACQDDLPNKSLTAPDGLSFGKPVGGACDDGRAKLIGTQRTDLWAKPKADQANDMFAPVISLCKSNLDSARSLMLNYIQWTIDNRDSTKLASTSWQTPLLTHWNTVFAYVDYTGANAPGSVPVSVFGSEGAAKVIDWSTGGEIRALNAALTNYQQDASGDQRDHLFVIYPITSPCLSGNIQQFGPCFQISAFPHLPAGKLFSPKNKIGVCVVHSLGDEIEDHISSPALGHLDPLTRITETLTEHYPECGDVASIPAGSWNHGFGDAVRRLAWLAKKAVTPEPLYAVHGGLGGLGGGLSPFGAVDREVFKATFTSDAIGQQPGTPETGTWSTIFATAPGSITVQGSLGQQSSNLAVLNQSGGNCAKCGGLLLEGRLETAGTADSIGVYDAQFVALQAQSNMKEAVFALRDNSDRDIATVTFAVRNNTNLILYNDKKGSPALLLGNWVRYTPYSFRIRVDLDADKTTVWFNGSSTESYSNQTFLNTGAKNFSKIAADFRGIDSGSMGWDEITVTRLPDSNH
jgi:hypothetical protein